MRIIFVDNPKCVKAIQNKVLRANAGEIPINLDFERLKSWRIIFGE